MNELITKNVQIGKEKNNDSTWCLIKMQRLANVHAPNAKNYHCFERKRKYVIQNESFDLYL